MPINTTVCHGCAIPAPTGTRTSASARLNAAKPSKFGSTANAMIAAALASPTHPGRAVSRARRFADAVDPSALLLRRGKRKPQLLLQGSREETPDRVPLPPRGAGDFPDGYTFGALQHCDHRRLL